MSGYASTNGYAGGPIYLSRQSGVNARFEQDRADEENERPRGGGSSRWSGCVRISELAGQEDILPQAGKLWMSLK